MSPLTLLALLDTGLPGAQGESPLQMPLSIAYKELFLIVLAASLWDHQWSAKQVKICSDNTAVVKMLWSSTSRDSNLKVLLRHLSLLAARHSFAFTARHVSGKSNAIVDTIPHFEFQQFHKLAPYASPTATPVPPLEQTLLRFCSH